MEDEAVMMAVDFIHLAGMAGTGPEGDVPVHAMPHKPVTNETLGRANAWVGKSMEEVKHPASHIHRHERSWDAHGEVAQKHRAIRADGDISKRMTGDGCEGGQYRGAGILEGSKVRKVNTQ